MAKECTLSSSGQEKHKAMDFKDVQTMYSRPKDETFAYDSIDNPCIA